MNVTDDTFFCPSANPAAPDLQIDLSEIRAAEGRIHEIATLNPQKAPELLATLNSAWRAVNEHLLTLKTEAVRAARRVNEVRSAVLLDEVVEKLKAKGLTSPKSPAGSEDLRHAVLDGDQRYQDALERARLIECVVELIDGKRRSIEMAFYVAKEIMAGRRNGGIGNVSLPARLEEGLTAGQEENFHARGQFGKARY